MHGMATHGHSGLDLCPAASREADALPTCPSLSRSCATIPLQLQVSCAGGGRGFQDPLPSCKTAPGSGINYCAGPGISTLQRHNDFRSLEWDHFLLKLSPAAPARALGVGRARTQIPGRAGTPSPAIQSSSPRPRRGVRAHSPCHREFSHSWVKLSRALPKVRSDPGAATCVLQHGIKDPDISLLRHLPAISNASRLPWPAGNIPQGLARVTRGDTDGDASGMGN